MLLVLVLTLPTGQAPPAPIKYHHDEMFSLYSPLCIDPRVQSTFAIRLNTGAPIYVYGPETALPPGTPDPLWSLVSFPPLNLPGPAYSLGAFPLEEAWISNPESAWINPIAGTLDNRKGPAGDYLYRADFFIPTNSFAVVLNLRYAADNSVDLAYFDPGSNEHHLASTPSPAFKTWNVIPPTPISTKGLHTLDALVHNDGLYTGLNVAGNVTGRCAYP